MSKQEPEIEVGTGVFGMSCYRVGQGPPVGLLSPLNTSASEFGRNREISFMKPLIERFTVCSMSCRPGLPASTTMKTLAADYANAIKTKYSQPIDIIGISTGGAVALQFALDHPELVGRVVILAAGPRLSARGSDGERRCAELLEAGRPKAAQRALANALTNNATSAFFMGMATWLGAAFTGAGRGQAGLDMARVLRAEVNYDVSARMAGLRASALFVCGVRDPCYAIGDVRQVVSKAPHAQLVEFDAGHIGVLTTRKLWPEVTAFLNS
jgi:pimeloyl-ACP methyl ester carboxylesterase